MVSGIKPGIVAVVIAALLAGSVHAEIPALQRNAEKNRLDIDGLSLQGVCAARDDFQNVLREVQNDDEQSAYLRDIRNYFVNIAILDRHRIRVSFGPAPRTQYEISSGGGAVYVIDRNSGRVLERTLEE